MARFEISPEQRQETRITYPLPHASHQQFVVHRVEVAGQITFDHPAPPRIGAVLQLQFHRADGVMHTALRPETIRETMKVALPNRLHDHEHSSLHDPISESRNAQRSLFAIGFRKIDTLGRLRLIRAGQQLGSDRLQLKREFRFHRVFTYSIDARCVGATRRQRHASRLLQPGPVGNYPQKTVESTSLVFRGPCGQLALHFTDYQRSSPLYGRLICQASCSNCSPSPCSRLSLPQTVGSEGARRSAGPRPPLKPDIQFSRIRLSQR